MHHRSALYRDPSVIFSSTEMVTNCRQRLRLPPSPSVSATLDLPSADVRNRMPVATQTLAKLDATHGADAVAPLGPVRVVADTGDATQSAVVGTYLLEESHNGDNGLPRRTGTVDVVSATYSESRNSYMLQTNMSISLPAVLDICPFSLPSTFDTDKAAIIAACADGTLYLLQSPTPFCTAKLDLLLAKNPTSNDLSLAVHVTDKQFEDTVVACSNSAGFVGVYQFQKGELSPIVHRKMHDAEAWTVHIVQTPSSGQNVVVSGGDDGVLTALDPREGGPVWRVRNAHDGLGVTTLAWHADTPETLWTGGYDDCVKVWDVRSLRVPVSKQSLNIGGGVWRLRFHPRHTDLLLAAAMYNGCKVVRRHADQSLSIEASYMGHKSIAYGACWLSDLNPQNSLCALTGSFYDRSIQLWALDSEPFR